MSTMSLTIIAILAGLGWFLAGAAYSLWRHRVSHALAQLGGVFLIGHLTLVSLGWAGAAQEGDWSNPSLPAGFRWLAEPTSQMPTSVFDLSAWIAIALLMASMAVDAVQQYRARQQGE